MNNTALESAWEQTRARLAADGRAFILAMVQLPGVDGVRLRDPGTVQAVLEAAFGNEYFPVGPFSYVDTAPRFLMEPGPDRAGGMLLHDSPRVYLEGHFGFAHDGDVVAGWAFTRARPADRSTDVLLIDLEAVLAETFVMAASAARVLGHPGECRLLVGLAMPAGGGTVRLQALDEETGEVATVAAPTDGLIPVQATCDTAVGPAGARDALYLAATDLARQFGVSGPQFLTPARTPLPEPLTPHPPAGPPAVEGAA